ncbi:MAG: hypothetical protein HN909_01620 [Phycisphaerales bacterium]|nr:hypothetical protein [Phycisphaerales bacterium]
MLVLAGLSGCIPETGRLGTTPIAVQEYNNMGKLDRDRYTDPVVAEVNMVRAMASELPLEERLASLELVDMIATSNPAALDMGLMNDLAAQLRDSKTPPKLKAATLRFLLRQNFADLAAYIIPQMDSLNENDEMKALILTYLRKNPDSQMLSRIVRAWWGESESAEIDASYRKVVEQISGTDWVSALLGGLNSRTFNAEGEAMGLLAKKLSEADLRSKVTAMHPETDAIRALQQYIDVFDYLPKTPEELISSVVIYKARGPKSTEGDMLPDAARMGLAWTENYKYNFCIRDFHLLSRLARDPLRNNLKQTQLVLDVGRAVKTRRHAKHAPDGKATTASDNYWFNMDKLTMADLWNLYLLNEMLLRPHEQSIFGLMATRDLNDTVSAWGGLVFYENGQAEASIYHPKRGSDLEYQPQANLIKDGRDSLCRFICHFEKVNSDRVGPTAKELADAKDSAYYGLILTRVDKDTFAAHYYNPDGLVVSLGKFPLRVK